tara:strand:- start:210 stop:437 length:228 start_codon:yes stop_codon:yes gene_type:complete
MGLSTILFLMLIVLVGIFSFLLLELNKLIVHLDLLFLQLDLQLGYLILFSILMGIIITVILEFIFFFSKRKNNNE